MRQLDELLERLGKMKTTRVLAWSAVAGWCGFVAWQLAPSVLP